MPIPNSAEEQSFNEFLDKLKRNDERAWSQLNFVLKRILGKWLSKKNIYKENYAEIYSNVLSVFIEKISSLSFENFTSLKSYIFSIAENKVKEFYRKTTKNNKNEPIEEHFDSDYLFIIEGDNEDKNERIQKIFQFFSKLTEVEQNVMKLLYIEEKSIKEVSIILGLTEGNVRVIKHRAIEKLKGWL